MKSQNRKGFAGCLLLIYIVLFLLCYVVSLVADALLSKDKLTSSDVTTNETSFNSSSDFIYESPSNVTLRFKRRLLESSEEFNCSPASIEEFPRPFMSHQDRVKGGVAFFLFVGVYCFLALSVICDDYFMPSLDRIVERYNISPHVAGASIMAIGSSAPELGAGILGVFVTKNDVGVGTVVGSAVYNIAFIIALCGLFGKGVIYISWWSLTRDCFFYMISIAALVIAIWDKKIGWIDSTCLVVLYICYMLLMKFNQRIEAFLDKFPCFDRFKPSEYKMNGSVHSLGNVARVNGGPVLKVALTIRPGSNVESNGPSERNGRVFSINIQDPEPEENLTPIPDSQPRTEHNDEDKKETVSSSSDSSEEEEEEDAISPFVVPKGTWARFIWGAAYPVIFMFHFTVPNCKRKAWRKWFRVAFFTSCIWISVITYVLVWMITVVGTTWGIPDTIMGLTIIAAGVSIPDTMASVLVARKGQGSMAISNAVGSNVFDILICLGIPWFLKTAIVKPGSTVTVYTDGLLYTILSLSATCVFVLVAAHFNGWKLNKKIGGVILVWYAFFMTISILYQMNIFSDVNIPTCPSDF